MRWLVLVAVLAVFAGCSSVSPPDTSDLQKELQRLLKDEGRGVYLEALVASHPRSEISEDFLALLREETVRIYDVSRDPARGPSGPAGVAVEDSNGSLVPRLELEQEFFEWEVKLLWIALVHEYEHVKDLLEGRANLEWRKGRITERIVRDYFEEEANAYKAQCRFAKEIAMTSSHAACEVLEERGELAFRQGLANILSGEERFTSYKAVLFEQAKRGKG